MTQEEFVAFVRLVAGMRFHQRLFFKERRGKDAAAAKDYERRVDRIVGDILSPPAPSLFGDPGKEVAE